MINIVGRAITAVLGTLILILGVLLAVHLTGKVDSYTFIVIAPVCSVFVFAAVIFGIAIILLPITIVIWVLTGDWCYFENVETVKEFLSGEYQ